MTPYERSGTSFGFEPGNDSKRVPGRFLARTSNLALEMLENGFVGIFWREFLAWAWKYFKMVSLEPSGVNL